MGEGVATGGTGGGTRLAPRVRYGDDVYTALPTINPRLIESFLAEPLVVDELTLQQAPRIVAAREGRVLLASGDRAYVRSAPGAAPLADPVRDSVWRIFDEAVPLADPVTKEVLGYEARYLGRAELVRGESQQAGVVNGETVQEVVPATIDITANKEEIRAGDRLLPEPPRQFPVYVPRRPAQPVEARVVSIYGSAVANAPQYQVVTINKGRASGIEPGHVFAILSEGDRLVDKTIAGERTPIKLPDERNGLLMVFRAFDRVSYALVLESQLGTRVGDRLVVPR